MQANTIERLDQVTRDAVASVAKRHGLAPRWLNDAAASFRPEGFDPDACEVLTQSDSLVVRGVPADQVFLMELNAARAVDTADLRAIWPLCTFESTTGPPTLKFVTGLTLVDRPARPQTPAHTLRLSAPVSRAWTLLRGK